MSAMHQVRDFNEAAIVCFSCPVMCTFALTTGCPLLLRGEGPKRGSQAGFNPILLETIASYDAIFITAGKQN